MFLFSSRGKHSLLELFFVEIIFIKKNKINFRSIINNDSYIVIDWLFAKNNEITRYYWKVF